MKYVDVPEFAIIVSVHLPKILPLRQPLRLVYKIDAEKLRLLL